MSVLVLILGLMIALQAEASEAGFFWVHGAGPDVLARAEAAVEVAGGTVVYTYPEAVLALLPGPDADLGVSGRDLELTPLPDQRLVGHWQGSFDPLSRSVSEEILAEGGLWLVQMIGPLTDEWLRELERYQVETVTFFPYTNQLVRLPPSTAERLLDLAFVRSVYPWLPELKLDPETITWWRLSADREVEIKVVVFNPTGELDATLAEKSRIIELGGSIVDDGLAGNHQVIRVVIPADRLDRLASMANVIAVEAYHPPVVDDESSDLIVNGQYSGEVGSSPPSPTYASWPTAAPTRAGPSTTAVARTASASSVAPRLPIMPPMWCSSPVGSAAAAATIPCGH